MSSRSLAAVFLLLAAAAPAAASEPPEALTLRRAVERSLARDPALAAALRAADEGEAALRIADSPFKPQLLLSTTPGITTGLPLSVAGELPAAAGARLRLTLWDPSLAAEKAGARGELASLSAKVEAARMETIRRTVGAYTRLFVGQRRVETARRRLAASEALMARTAALSREGRAMDLDVARSALAVERARARLDAAEADRDLSAETLRREAGLPERALPELADDPLAALGVPREDGAILAALSADPALKAFSAEIAESSRAASLEARWFKPQVVAEARYSYVPSFYDYDKYYLKVDTNTGSAGLSVVLPLYSGGLDAARGAKARAREARVREERRAREDEVVREAHAAVAGAGRAGREMGLARRALAVEEEGLRVARTLAAEGRGEADGVPRADLALADAEDELTGATESLVAARLGLLAVRGELSLLGPVAAGR